MKRSLLVLICFIVFISALGFIRIPHVVKLPCKFVAQAEWSLSLYQTEKILSRYTENMNKLIDQIDLLQFDRPDFVSFQLCEGLKIGKRVKKNEHIGTFYSSENHLRMAELKSNLIKTRAELDAFRTGEKKALQEEAKQALEQAMIKLNAAEPELERRQKLSEKNLISQENFEQTLEAYELLKVNVSMCRSRLDAVSTGAKPEQLNIFYAELKGLENQIDILENKMVKESIQSPIRGMIVDPKNETSLCKIEKIDSMICYIPIPEWDIQYIHKDQNITIRSNSSNWTKEAKIKHIGQKAYIINNQSMFVAKALLDNNSGDIISGTRGQVEIKIKRVSVYELFKKSFAKRF